MVTMVTRVYIVQEGWADLSKASRRLCAEHKLSMVCD